MQMKFIFEFKASSRFPKEKRQNQDTVDDDVQKFSEWIGARPPPPTGDCQN